MFRVRVRRSSTTHRGSGYGMEVLQNSQKFQVVMRMLYQNPYPHPFFFQMAYPFPGYCAAGVQNSQKSRVQVLISYRIYRSSGTGITREIPRVWFCRYHSKHNLGKLDNCTLYGWFLYTPCISLLSTPYVCTIYIRTPTSFYA